MTKITLAISLLFGLSATAYSQEQMSQLLLHAAQCLEAKQVPSVLESNEVDSGYLLDAKSYPGTKRNDVEVYAAPARSNGLVFAIVSTKRAAMMLSISRTMPALFFPKVSRSAFLSGILHLAVHGRRNTLHRLSRRSKSSPGLLFS